jgi:drug/metabolite transporter (DMT)-like permease
MMTSDHSSPGASWLLFAILTVGCWGTYGVFLHSGQLGMNDPANGRYKAFLLVGVAYFLVAILGPVLLLLAKGAAWNFPLAGAGWSLLAGVVGALGALGVLLAFGAKGTPAVVMSIVFAGAPIVNAVYSLILHPPLGGWSKLPLPFIAGIVLAAVGGCLVTLYKPMPAPKAAPPAAVQSAAAQPAAARP